MSSSVILQLKGEVLKHACSLAAGFDASYMDPLGHMMLGSEDYRYFTAALQQHAASSPHCQVSCAEGTAPTCWHHGWGD
jgi:acetoin utilization deacetylase AcuC-like enzyme